MDNHSISSQLKIEHGNLNAYSTGLLQGKAYRALNNSLNKVLYTVDLTVPEWKLLGQLHDHGIMKLAQIADRLDVEPPLVTALIDRLEKKGFVSRDYHPQDKRAKIISITPKGVKTVKYIEPEVKKIMRKLLNGVSHQDLIVYIKILETIVNNAS